MQYVLIRQSLTPARGTYRLPPVGFAEYPLSTGEKKWDGPWREVMGWLRHLEETHECPAGFRWRVIETRRVIDAAELERWLRTR